MRVQETPDEIPEGGTPHTVSLLMHDKLVDVGKPGDRVEVRLSSSRPSLKLTLQFKLYMFFMNRLLGFTEQ